MHGLATARQRVGALLALALLLGGCGAGPTPGPPVTTTFLPAAKPVPTQAGVPISTAPPARLGTPLPGLPPPVSTEEAVRRGIPLPSATPPPPTATLPPPGPTPGPDAFAARLTFTPTLSTTEFKALIVSSGIQLQQVFVRSGNPNGGAGGVAGHDTAEVLRSLDQAWEGAVNVSGADVTLDHGQYTRLRADGRITVATGMDGAPASGVAPILARWQAAFGAVVTVRGRQEVVRVDSDGTPITANADAGARLLTDEIYDMHPRDMTARYRFTAHRPDGEVTTLWDGTHAYRYWAARHEVYRPQPENLNTYWGDGIDDQAIYTFLQPAPSGYNLVGPRQIDGRAVIELVVATGNFGAQGMAGTKVFLDAATYLPYQVMTYPFGDMPGGQARGGLQRTFTALEINSPVTAADFAAGFPPGTITIYEQASGAPRLAGYPDLHTAAQAADFPLYAPVDMLNGLMDSTSYAQYFVEIEGRRSPVIALNNGAILEGRYLPVQDLEIAADATAPPQSLTLDGQPATLDHGVLTFTRGLTHIRISGVQSAEQAASVVQQLQLVP